MTPEPDIDTPSLAAFVAQIPAAVAWFDGELRYLAASAAWAAAFGISAERLAGERHGALSETGQAALAAVQQRALAGETVANHPIAAVDPAGQMWPGRLSAQPYRGPSGILAGIIVALDIAAAGAEGATAPGAAIGLAERQAFARRLRDALADADPERGDSVVFAINLDRFRGVNSLYGTAIGDRVLEVTAGRLIAGTRSRLPGEPAVARATDLVARLGADEFGIICGAPAFPIGEAHALAARLLRAVQHPITVGEHSLRLTASIGFLVLTAAHRREGDVLRDLDLALQHAKSLGPNKVVAWEPTLTAAATRRYSLAEQLRQAFERGEFILHYQPVLRLSDNRMVGAEALLRWNHPSEGLVAGATFVPILEETGLILEVGSWTIRETVRQLESWRVLYGRHVIDWVSVNLAARQFSDPEPLLATLRAIFGGGFSPDRLKLEIAETAFMRDPDITRAVLAELDKLGMRVAIDDFGTGYSSVNSLRHYAIDAIKIEREFVAQIGTMDGERLVQALLDITRMFGAAIVAEGIETEGQREFLREAGCDLGQGYLFAEPMDGALLGAYALTHAVETDRAPPPRPAGGPANPPTSAGRLPAA
ncbi:MAG TPA: EAL domain-containing protein [Stellaceae bacterium]|nr:EAL domain-containing protein [Stellaceae bacterium]